MNLKTIRIAGAALIALAACKTDPPPPHEARGTVAPPPAIVTETTPPPQLPPPTAATNTMSTPAASARIDLQPTPATDSVKRVTTADLQAMLKASQVVIVDVRTAEVFNREHIPGAINIPETEIGLKASMLPKYKRIVTYCT